MKAYAHYVEPEKYPAFETRPVPSVTHKAMNNEIQFISARFFPVEAETNRFINIASTFERYISKNDIGKCFWLNWKTLTVENLKELIDEIAKRDCWLYGFWGFVPGEQADAKSNPWGEFEISDELNQYISEKLGDRFLGYEAGEQDGRYIASYACRRAAAPNGNARKVQYAEFRKFMQRIEKNFHYHITVLGSLPYHHYCAASNSVSFLGCASAQAFPNSQMWYGFIRGASKQYGLLCFGDVSVWNRWGYKTYKSANELPDTEKEVGAEYGTSLSLIKRLIYTQYMYNCVLLGIEQSWFYDDDIENYIENKQKKGGQKDSELSPIGQLQQSVNRYVKKYGKPGVMYTPFAVVADRFSGWVPPRTLFSQNLYQVWGNLPYKDGDYQLHLLFSMLYPGYENSGFFHNETGFLTPTPYGEITDVLLSDAPAEILCRYKALLITNGTELDYEFFCKLKSYVSAGGHIIIFADTIAEYSYIEKYDPGYYTFFGLDSALNGSETVTDFAVQYKETTYLNRNIELFSAKTNGRIIAVTDNDLPAAVESTCGNGKVTLILAKNGLERYDYSPLLSNNINNYIFSPYEYAGYIKEILKDIFTEMQIVYPNNQALQYIVNISEPDQLTLLVSNNTFIKQCFEICANIPILSVSETETDCDLKSVVGYYPPDADINNTVSAGNGDTTIEAGEVKLFKIKLAQKLSLEKPLYPQKPKGRYFVSIPSSFKSATDFLLQNPAMPQHFEGIVLDAAAVENADTDFIKKEAVFLRNSGLKAIVDFTSLLNHFPDFSFMDSFPARQEESYERLNAILEKALNYSCFAVILSPPQNPEGNSDMQMLKSCMKKLFEHISQKLKPQYTRIIVQNSPFVFCAEELYAFLNRIESTECGFNCSAALSSEVPFKQMSINFPITSLIVSSPYRDELGQFYHAQLPFAGSPFKKEITDIIAKYKKDGGNIVILNGAYRNYSELYADFEITEKIYNRK